MSSEKEREERFLFFFFFFFFDLVSKYRMVLSLFHAYLLASLGRKEKEIKIEEKKRRLVSISLFKDQSLRSLPLLSSLSSCSFTPHRHTHPHPSQQETEFNQHHLKVQYLTHADRVFPRPRRGNRGPWHRRPGRRHCCSISSRGRAPCGPGGRGQPRRNS